MLRRLFALCAFVATALGPAMAHAEATEVPPAASTGDRPLLISSWHGNNFGVVAELRGSYRLEGRRLTIDASSLRLRQVVNCSYGCITIKQVRIGVYGDSSPKNFSTYTESAPLALDRSFDRGAVLDLGSQTFVLELRPETPLTRLWLGIQIANAKGDTYYAHTRRNFFVPRPRGFAN